MWEDVAHEFHFVPDDKLAFVCKEALSNAEAAVRRGRDQVPAHTSAEFAIVDLLIATEAILVGAKKSVIDREDYNRWVREIGGDSSETMTVGEHLASCLEIVQKVRKETYPMWSSLIDLLPDGMTKEQATQKLRSGCKSVGLDTGDVLPDWQVSANN